jgi:hypothetical protein
MTSKEKEQAQAHGAALGLTPQQIQETLDGETELSPEAIAGRAKGRKEEAYQKEFGDSDKQWAELLEKYPDQKAMLEGLSPQEKKDALAKGKENAGEKIASAKEKGKLAAEEYKYSGEQDMDALLFDKVDALGERAKRASDSARKSAEDTRSTLADIDKGRKERDALAATAMSEYEALKNKSPDKPQREPMPVTPVRPDHVYGQSLSGDFKQVAGGTLGGAHAILSGTGEVIGGVTNWALDRVTNAGNYIEGRAPNDRIATHKEIKNLAESKGVSFREAEGIFYREQFKRKTEERVKNPTAPQASIQRVEVDDLFNSLDKSQSRANLMTRPLMS